MHQHKLPIRKEEIGKEIEILVKLSKQYKKQSKVTQSIRPKNLKNHFKSN